MRNQPQNGTKLSRAFAETSKLSRCIIHILAIARVSLKRHREISSCSTCSSMFVDDSSQDYELCWEKKPSRNREKRGEGVGITAAGSAICKRSRDPPDDNSPMTSASQASRVASAATRMKSFGRGCSDKVHLTFS